MPELEPELATVLTEDASPEVRERLAAHTRDLEVIAALLQDRTVRVRKGLAVNPQLTAEHRHTLAQDSSPDVRVVLVRSQELAEDDLRELVDDRSADVRRALATSPFTPKHIREALQNDADETVAVAARGPGGAPAATPRAGHRRTLGKRFPGKS
jgi:hypothetical protein